MLKRREYTQLKHLQLLTSETGVVMEGFANISGAPLGGESFREKLIFEQGP